MGKFSIILIVLAFFCVNIHLVYAQTAVTPVPAVTAKSLDVNNDGKADVVYHSDGKYVSKVEADTNYDGEYDITIYTKDGNFESAEADTDYDGKPDKKFSDVKEFNQWLNEKRPDFEDELNRPDWQFDLLKF